MTATLTAPSPVTPGSRIKVVGRDFPADKVYLTLDGQGKTTNVFGAPTFEVWINVSTQVRVQTLIAYLRSTNQELARATINVQKVVPPPTPTGRPLVYLPTPNSPVPAYLTPTTDPTWKTTIARVSDIAGEGIAYSRLSADNADGSRIALLAKYPGAILDGKTYARLGSIYQSSGALWSNADPNVMYGVDAKGDGNRLWKQDARVLVPNISRTVLYTFTGYDQIYIGGDYGGNSGEGGISDDDRYIVVTAYKAGMSPHILVLDTVNKEIVGDMVAPSGLDNAQISRKGNYVVIVAGDTKVYNRNLTNPRQLFESSNHGDNVLNAAGEEVFFTNNAVHLPGQPAGYGLGVQARRLSDLALTQLLPNGTAFGNGHASGRGTLPVLSNYDPITDAGKPGCDQVVSANPDGTVNVFCFAHHKRVAYDTEPHATGLRDGRRVAFNSDWGGGPVYAYVASL